ncbi:SURF1 family protein [Kitasatospora sp. NPDC058184]|uniref:SURF1 family protein n=1 Tax=Kitasatospora sp. NPDC058184 TaxID=3346370 RepID=UPI0036DC5AF9
MYRFLLTPRWLAGAVVALAAVTVCLWLGTWQLGRFQDRLATHRATDRPAAGAVPLEQLLTRDQPLVTTTTAGRTVLATGGYDSAHQLLVPSRLLGGEQGYFVLTPLRTDGGPAVAVVRGWAPDPPAADRVPAAPTGRVTVTGRLQAPEDSGRRGAIAGGLPAGQLGTISPAALVNLLPYPVYDGWVAADAAPAGLTPVADLRQQDGNGLTLRAFQNLGYTLEWFVFAGFVVFMGFRLALREAEVARDRALGLTESASAI